MSLNPKNLSLAAAITLVLSQAIITIVQTVWTFGLTLNTFPMLGAYLLVTMPINGVVSFCTAYVLAKIYNRLNRMP